MTPKLKRLIVILPVIVVLVVLGATYFTLQITSVKASNDQLAAAAPVTAAPVQENGTAMAPAADTSVSPEKAAAEASKVPATAKVAPLADGTVAKVPAATAAAPAAAKPPVPAADPAAAAKATAAAAAAAAEAAAAKAEKNQPKMSCNYDGWVGKDFDEHTVQATGRAYMLLHPEEKDPLEYQADRIKVRVDKDRKVTKVTCG